MLLGPIVSENIFQVGSYCPYQGRIMCIQDKLDNIFAYYLMTSTFTVELHWLELEGTVKMCSSYRKFEPQRSRNFRERENLVLTRDSFITL